MVFSFFFRNVEKCRSKFLHLEEDQNMSYKRFFRSIYNPTIFNYNGNTYVGYKNKRAGSTNYNLDSLFCKTSHLLINKYNGEHVYTYINFNGLSFEDVRIFSLDLLLGVSSIKENGIIKPILFIFDNIKTISKFKYLRSEDTINGINAKNWILVKKGDDIFVHTDTYPAFVVQKLNKNQLYDNGEYVDLEPHISQNTEFLKQVKSFYPIKKIHNTSNWINFKGNYLAVAHFVYREIGYLRRIYRSMFLFIDKDTFTITKYSDWICFGKKCECIQFVSSLLNLNGKIVVGLGINDSFSHFKYYSPSEVYKSLTYRV